MLSSLLLDSETTALPVLKNVDSPVSDKSEVGCSPDQKISQIFQVVNEEEETNRRKQEQVDLSSGEKKGRVAERRSTARSPADFLALKSQDLLSTKGEKARLNPEYPGV